MNVYVLNDPSSGMQLVLLEASRVANVEYLDSLEELLTCDFDQAVVMLDLDDKKKESEKIIKELRSTDDTIPLVAITETMDAKAMSKHQLGKFGCDLYLRPPTTASFIKSMFDQFYEQNLEINDEVLEESDTISLNDQTISLEEEAEVQVEDQNENKELDFVIADSEPELIVDEIIDNQPEEIELNSGQSEGDGFELVLDDSTSSKDENDLVSLDLDEIPQDLSIHEEEEVGFELDLSEDEEINLDEGANQDVLSLSDEGEELELGNDEELQLSDDSEIPSGDLVNISDMDLELENAPVEKNDEAMSKNALEKMKEIEEMMMMDDNAPEFTSSISQVEDHLLQAADSDALTSVGLEISSNTPSTLTSQHSNSLNQDLKDVNLHLSNELERLGETVSLLREDRKKLQEQVHKFENLKNTEEQYTLDLKAELEETKLQLAIQKKRSQAEIDDLKYKLDIVNDKKDLLEEKLKQQLSLETNRKKQVHLDQGQLRSREKELEGQLELVKADAQVQLRNRDQMILELKRRIDTIEFDLESVQSNRMQQESSQTVLEDKVKRISNSLKRIIEDLEEDDSITHALENIKNSLDV